MIKSGTIVRIYSPAGSYWRKNFVSKHAVYINEDDLIFSACHFDESSFYENSDYFSEFNEPTVEELRLLAALVLSVGFLDGMLTIYPLRASHRLPSQPDLSRQSTIREISEVARNKLKFRSAAPWHNGYLPPAFSGFPYRFRPDISPTKLQRQIFARTDSADNLLMRGIGAFIQAGMLSCHDMLFGAAPYPLYVSLDASFELVKRKMRDRGYEDPSALDAGAYLEKMAQDSPTGKPYFADYYEDRVRTFHTASRFGISPYLPLVHDDFYSLYYALREVYRLLILGKHIDLTDRL